MPEDFSSLCSTAVFGTNVVVCKNGLAQDTYAKEFSLLGDLETSAHGRKRISPSRHSRQEFVEALPGYD